MRNPGTVDLSTANLQLTARLIARHREAVGSMWRRLEPGQQALFALVYLRRHDTYAARAEGWRIGSTIAWRYVREVVSRLAALAPSLPAALWGAASRGLRWLLLDGTCAEIDRINDLRHTDQGTHVDRYWCRRHRHHEVKFAGLAAHDGNLLWIGTGYAYTGASERVEVPFKGRDLPEVKCQHNRVVNSVRALVERAFSVFKRWAIFNRARCCPNFPAKSARPSWPSNSTDDSRRPSTLTSTDR